MLVICQLVIYIITNIDNIYIYIYIYTYILLCIYVKPFMVITSVYK